MSKENSPILACSAPPPSLSNRQLGLTLIELILVILIIGLIFSIALPSATLLDEEKLNLAASEVAAAIRYTRDSAVREGNSRRVLIQRGTNKVEVYLNDLVTLARHPVDKKAYLINLATHPGVSGVDIANASDPFTYDGVGVNKQDLYFDSDGFPYFVDGTSMYPLASSNIKLKLGEATKSIIVEPITGRVLIQ